MRINVTFHKPSVGHIDWDVVSEALGDWPVVSQLPPLRTFTISVPDDAAEQVLADLLTNPNIKRAKPDSIGTQEGFIVPTSNDPLADTQYALKRMGVFEAHQYQTGSSSVVVAVVDSGLNILHDEFKDRGIVGYEVDAVNAPWDVPTDYHGTWCASCIAPAHNNGLGVAGVAPGVTLMPVRCDSMEGGELGYWASGMADALLIAQANGADIISWSFSFPNDEEVLNDALDFILAEGVLVFRSAGNGGRSNPEPMYPQHLGVPLVGSIKANDYISEFSSYGEVVDIVAPGSSIKIANTGTSDYANVSGTSFSCPHVAAVAALVKSENPSLPNTEIIDLLYATADPVISHAFDIFFPKAGGIGCVNAHKAVLKAKSLLAENAENLYPYINFLGPNVTKTIAAGEMDITISNPAVIDTGFYGQTLPDNPGIEISQGEEVLYSGQKSTYTPGAATGVLVDKRNSADFTGFTGSGYSISTSEFYSGDASLKINTGGTATLTIEGGGSNKLLSIRMKSITSYKAGQGYSANKITINGVTAYESPSFTNLELIETAFEDGLRHYVLDSAESSFEITFTSTLAGTVNYTPDFKIDSITITEYAAAVSTPVFNIESYTELVLAVISLPAALIKQINGEIAGILKKLNGATGGTIKRFINGSWN